MTEANKNQIINFIQNEANNDNFLNFGTNDVGSIVINALDEYLLPAFEIKKMDLSEVEFQEVFEAIKQYIRNNPEQFEIGELVGEKFNWRSGSRDGHAGDWEPEEPNNPETFVTPIDIAAAGRPWFSPIITTNCRRKSLEGSGRVKLPNGQFIFPIFAANCRRIKHLGASRNRLEPSAFTAEQFEELKNLVPGHCRIKGCYNFFSFRNDTHPGPYGQEGHEVADDICSFHRLYPDYHYDILEEFGINTNPPQNNIADASIQDYNDQITQELEDIQARSQVLFEEADEKLDLLISLGIEDTPEVVAQVGLIFQFCELMRYKEKLEGKDGDQARQVNNQVIEARNAQLVQEWENNFIKKQAAVNELQKIFDRVNNPDDPNKNPEPPEPDNQNNLPDLSKPRQRSIDAIKVVLAQDPKLTNDDLSSSNWEDLINTAKNKGEIDNIRYWIMVDIAAKRKTKKEAENLAKNLETEGKDAEQLRRRLKEAEKIKGRQSYEDNKTGISNLKEELSKKVSQEEYLQIITNAIEVFLLKCGVESNELDPEVKKKLKELKGGKVKNFHQVSQAEEEITKNVGEKGARKKLDVLFGQVTTALKTGKKVEEVKNKLNVFKSSDVIYEKVLLSQEAKKIESYLNQLENYSPNHSQSPSRDIPWTMIISIFLFIVFLIGIKIYWKRKRRRSY